MNKQEGGIGLLQNKIRLIMWRRKWWYPHEIADILRQQQDGMYSDSTITARFRQMKDVRCQRFDPLPGSKKPRYLYVLTSKWEKRNGNKKR